MTQDKIQSQENDQQEAPDLLALASTSLEEAISFFPTKLRKMSSSGSSTPSTPGTQGIGPNTPNRNPRTPNSRTRSPSGPLKTGAGAAGGQEITSPGYLKSPSAATFQADWRRASVASPLISAPPPNSQLRQQQRSFSDSSNSHSGNSNSNRNSQRGSISLDPSLWAESAASEEDDREAVVSGGYVALQSTPTQPTGDQQRPRRQTTPKGELSSLMGKNFKTAAAAATASEVVVSDDLEVGTPGTIYSSTRTHARLI